MLMSRLASADFSYHLPERLVARYPTASRGDSRMLVLNRLDGALAHKHFSDLPGYLEAGDLLVLNNTRALPARLHARKRTGGKVELLVDSRSCGRQLWAHIKASHAPAPGSELVVSGAGHPDTECILRVIGRESEYPFLFELELLGAHDLDTLMAEHGELALPPYLNRREEQVDRTRYQTVYATQSGAVAAPTAGLHFTERMLRTLESAGIQVAYITLHVGYGTFAPVRTRYLQDHEMHSEYLEVDAATCAQVERTRASGRKVVAVGTTVVRALESAAAAHPGKQLRPYKGNTRLFIYPGHRFAVVQALLSNFHQPGTTLLPLVAAFGGKAHTMNAYREALSASYRFLSYGDVMLVGDW